MIDTKTMIKRINEEIDKLKHKGYICKYKNAYKRRR